jgi:hypothetical protein
VENANGGVRASGGKKGAEVRGSFGGISLEGISGPLEVRNQNGTVTVGLVADGCVRVSLTNSFGLIRLAVPEGLGFDLSASTTFGSIRSELPVSTPIARGQESLLGKVGAGGCPVTLTNANGSIEIVTAGPSGGRD